MGALKKVGWFRAVARYYRDPSASVLGKLVAVLALIYVVMPVDLVPDVPLIGWLDDLGVVGLATAWLTRRVSTYRAPTALPESGEDDARASRKPFSMSP
jgi:uncharacterized membrane protein YkvA (DUF1232 family)